MAVACPYCEFKMSIKGAKAGRYTPACQGCGRKFLIVVPEGEGAVPVVKTFEAGVAEVKRTMAGHAKDEGLGVRGQGSVTVGPERREHREKVVHSAVMETQAPSTSVAPVARGVVMGERTSEVAARKEPEITGNLGGYAIERKLGEGGMGAVYLAKQVSLDRPVAVKVMNREWANDPAFIARFTREAYAAAQLTHHNIVQIHDIGVEGEVHYFSMEYVPGKTLNQIVREQGRIDPEVAAGYTLQAARGLKFAHDHGMIHRDIKPENLLLNEQGIVKVLDLGLVKTPDSREALTKAGEGIVSGKLEAGGTQMNVSMGTPAYMSPEQAADAAGVDQRADVYSLGCTLYDLVVGKPPFEGKTVVEVLTKHASEPLTPPDVLVKRVPPSLSAIVQRMVAKKKEERYGSMEGVVKELEEFLGITSTGPFSPREEHASLLERCVEGFNKSGMASVRRNLVRGFFWGGLALIAVFLIFGMHVWAGALAGLLVLTGVSYQVVIGVLQKTHLFTRMRQLVFGARVVEWLKFLGFAGLTVLVLYILGLLWIWVGVAVGAVAIALGVALGLDTAVRKQRKPQVDEVQAMLKGMRLKGLEEDALRQFVCKYSGKHWEEFYEALFGYEAKMQAREAWGRGEGGRARKKFGAWRDGLIAWAEGRMKKRQEARERKLLEKLEEKSLRAKGANEVDARRKAKDAANWMVDKAVSAKEEKRRRVMETAGPGMTAVAAPVVAVRFDEEPDEKEMAAAKRERARMSGSTSAGGGLGLMLLGPHVRLLLGIVCIAVCLLWLHQNDSLHAEKVQAWISGNMQGAFTSAAKPWEKVEEVKADPLEAVKLKSKMEPLKVPVLSARLGPQGNWKLFNSLSWGVAGVMLVLAAFYRGVKISFLVIPAAVVMVAGEFLGVPGVWRFEGWQVAYVIGAGLAFLGFYWGKEKA